MVVSNLVSKVPQHPDRRGCCQCALAATLDQGSTASELGLARGSRPSDAPSLGSQRSSIIRPAARSTSTHRPSAGRRCRARRRIARVGPQPLSLDHADRSGARGGPASAARCQRRAAAPTAVLRWAAAGGRRAYARCSSSSVPSRPGAADWTRHAAAGPSRSGSWIGTRPATARGSSTTSWPAPIRRSAARCAGRPMRRPELLCERAHIGALADAEIGVDPESPLGSRPVTDRSRRRAGTSGAPQIEVLAGPRERVGALAVELDRRVGGRRQFQRAGHAAGSPRPRHRLPGGDVDRLEGLAVGVVGGRRAPEHESEPGNACRPSVRYSTSLVAAPTHTTSSPVAPGSRVPQCPTVRSCRAQRTQPTTSYEVGPGGLVDQQDAEAPGRAPARPG